MKTHLAVTSGTPSSSHLPNPNPNLTLNNFMFSGQYLNLIVRFGTLTQHNLSREFRLAMVRTLVRRS